MSRSVVGSALGAGSVGTGDGIPVVGARVGGVSVGPSVGAAVVGTTVVGGGVGDSVGVAPGIGAQPAPRQTPPQHVPAQYEPGQLQARLASTSSKRIRCLPTPDRNISKEGANGGGSRPGIHLFFWPRRPVRRAASLASR